MNRDCKRRSIFEICCPCFNRPPVICDEFVCSSFGKEFTEFEYVIENLAIRRAPKKLLDAAACCPPPKLKSCQDKCNKKCGRDFTGYVSKCVPPAVACGPVTAIEDCPPEETPCRARNHKSRHKSTTICPPLISHDPPCPTVYRKPTCPTCSAFFAETTMDLDYSTINQTLKPQPVPEEVQCGKTKVSVDVHKTSTDGDKAAKIIPTEIKKTIEALKVAKPLHLSAEAPAKNHRNLVRSLSTTSCDKETSCNFFDPKAEGDSDESMSKEKQEKLNRFANLMKRNTPPNKPPAKSTPSTSETVHFPDIIECDEVENSNLEPTEESGPAPRSEKKSKSQTLKWKIIINKHKKR